MRRSALIAACLAALLGGCGGHAPASPPRPRPLGIRASAPPGDSSFVPLRCLPDGPATVCTRHD